MKILFITWDGPQVHYLETLFLPIFAGLKQFGFHFEILQFRWGNSDQEEAVRAACAAAGCGYSSVRVWRFGSIGSLVTAIVGGLRMRIAARRFGADVLMPRSVLPSLVTLIAGGPRLRPVVLDADGLWPDELVDFAGMKTTGFAYRILRDIEAQMVRRAAAVIVRTTAAREILMARAGPPTEAAKYATVVNGRDDRVFHAFDEQSRLAVRSELGIAADAPLMVYVSSLGPKYKTRDVGELAVALCALRPDTRLIVLTPAPEQIRTELFHHWPDLAPITSVRSVPFGDVPRYIAAADVGAVFINETFATRAVVPIKTGEYLLCGVPTVGTSTIGDNEAAIGAGVFFDERHGPAAAARWVIDEILPNRDSFRLRARAVGLGHFSLERSIRDYRMALNGLPCLKRYNRATLTADHVAVEHELKHS